MQMVRTGLRCALTSRAKKNKIATFLGLSERNMHNGLRRHSLKQVCTFGSASRRVQGSTPICAAGECPRATAPGNHNSSLGDSHGPEYGTKPSLTRPCRRPVARRRRDCGIHFRTARQPAQNLLSRGMRPFAGFPAGHDVVRKAHRAPPLDRGHGK